MTLQMIVCRNTVAVIHRFYIVLWTHVWRASCWTIRTNNKLVATQSVSHNQYSDIDLDAIQHDFLMKTVSCAFHIVSWYNGFSGDWQTERASYHWRSRRSDKRNSVSSVWAWFGAPRTTTPISRPNSSICAYAGARWTVSWLRSPIWVHSNDAWKLSHRCQVLWSRRSRFSSSVVIVVTLLNCAHDEKNKSLIDIISLLFFLVCVLLYDAACHSQPTNRQRNTVLQSIGRCVMMTNVNRNMRSIWLICCSKFATIYWTSSQQQNPEKSNSLMSERTLIGLFKVYYESMRANQSVKNYGLLNADNRTT